MWQQLTQKLNRSFELLKALPSVAYSDKRQILVKANTIGKVDKGRHTKQFVAVMRPLGIKQMARRDSVRTPAFYAPVPALCSTFPFSETYTPSSSTFFCKGWSLLLSYFWIYHTFRNLDLGWPASARYITQLATAAPHHQSLPAYPAQSFDI